MRKKKDVVAYALGNFTGNQNKEFSDTGIILNVDLKINKANPFSRCYKKSFLYPNLYRY